MKVYDEFEQGTIYWHLARLGMPTASKFKTVMAKGRGGDESKTRDRYLHDLAAELYTGNPTESYRNHHMDRGNAQEEEALQMYAARTGAELRRVGFVRRDDMSCGICGASPDALIGDDGGVEIKTMLPGMMFKQLRFPDVPAEHILQLQGLMLVTGRKWWDIAIYCPGFDLSVHRVDADKGTHTEIIKYMTAFNQELASMVLDVTGQTIKTWRRRRDQELSDRLVEDALSTEGGNETVELREAIVGEQGVSADELRGDTAALLRASLELEEEEGGR